MNELIKLTRGKGQKDFIEAVNNFERNGLVKPRKDLRSNTCDCITGVWCEHLLTKKEYTAIINKAGFAVEYSPGYWDTHYKSAVMNLMAAYFNKIILLLGRRGIILSPFVNVLAYN